MKKEKKIIYFFPVKGFLAITLFGYIFAKRRLSAIELNHERIHIAQAEDCGGYFNFYRMYLDYWFCTFSKTKNNEEAYYSIPFEKEAYANQHNPDYLFRRRRGAWEDYY
jgi:hypothetical protein